MALFAKILLFFNLVAGGAFVYFAIENWQYRQMTAASVLRHQLLIVGLPLDEPDIPEGEEDPEIPFNYVSPAGAVTETVSKTFLEKYFEPAKAAKLGGPGIVNSQVAEVKRARQSVVRVINDPGSNKAFAAAAYLMPLVNTLNERARVAQLKKDNNGDELTSMLMKMFDEVENLNGTKDESERRFKIAHLLINLSPEEAWQQRVALVVGLKRYRSSLSVQADRFDQLVTQVQRLIEQDQSEYNEKIRSLEKQAISLTEKLMDSEKRKTAFLEQRTKDEEHLKQIQSQVAYLKTRFDARQAEVNALLARQAVAEQKLFEYQQMVGATLNQIFDLEAKLAERERDLRGVKP